MAGNPRLGRVARVSATAAVLVVLLVASLVPLRISPGAVNAASSQSSPAPVTPSLGPGPIASALAPVAADPGFAAKIIELGLDEATAAFLARTRSTVEVADAHSYVVRHAFLNGAEGEESYQLMVGSELRPGDPPEITYQVDGDELRYQLRYALDPADLPSDLRAQVLEGLPGLAEDEVVGGGGAIALTGGGLTGVTVRALEPAPLSPTRAVFAAEVPSTIQIVVDGVIKQGQSKAIGEFVKAAEKGGWTKSAKSYKAYKAGKKVWEAVEANELISSALQRLEALRGCAEQPTNPVTQEQYRDDPGERQKVLDELTKTENDIRESTVVMFTTMLVSTGSPLVKAAPWLGFITTPANDYVQANLRAHIEERVRAAEQRVVPCQLSFTIAGSAPSEPGSITLSGKTCSLEKPFKVQTDGDLLGTLKFTPNSATRGRWSYAGSETQAGLGVKGSGDYSVSLSDDLASGTIDFKFVTRLFIPGFGGKSGGGPVSLTLTKAPSCLTAEG